MLTVKIAGPVKKNMHVLAILRSLVKEIKLWLHSFKTSHQGRKATAGQREGSEQGGAF